MKRVKPDKVYPIPTIADCDLALARIAKLQRRLAAVDAEMNEAIDQHKARCARATANDRAELEQLINGIEAYGESNRAALFPGREKTKELPHGFIGFRISSSISVSKKTLELLKAAGKKLAIIVKESVDRDVLKTWSDAELAEFKAKRNTEDKFWFQIKDEEVARRSA